MKVLCSQEVVSPHLCGVVPCQVTIKASAPPGAMVCPLLVTPERRSGGHGTVQSIDFYALSCSSFRKQARNLIETAQRKSQPRMIGAIPKSCARRSGCPRDTEYTQYCAPHNSSPMRSR